jgi:hypothetical protein
VNRKKETTPPTNIAEVNADDALLDRMAKDRRAAGMTAQDDADSIDAIFPDGGQK